MGGWSGVYTQKGLSLLSRLTQGQSLAITRAVVGTGVVAENKLNVQTAVTGIKQELSFQTPSYPETGACKLPAFLNNVGLTVGYTAHQIGVYVRDTSGAEILYYLCQSTQGTEIPAESELPGYAATWTFYFKYGNADNITVTVNPANAVTYDMLEEVRIIAESGVINKGEGEVICIKDSANLPFPALNVYGKSTQNGTPTPDSPIDIETIGDDGSVVVNVFGKNVLENVAVTRTESGITFTVNGDGTVICNGTATQNAYLRVVTAPTPIKRGTYTLSGCPAGGGPSTYRLYSSEIGLYDNGKGSTVTVNADTTFGIAIAIFAGNTVKNLTFKPMLELGSVVTEFEPFIKQSATINVQNGICGVPAKTGGNYIDLLKQSWVCDEIDLTRAKYIKRVGTVDLGTLTWNYDTAYSVFTAYIDDIAPDSLNLLCTHYKVSHINSATSPDLTIYGRRAGELGGIGVKNSNYTDTASFKAAMSGAILLYELENPVETGISIDSLHSNNPITTIVNDSGAEMYAECIKKVNENAFGMPSASSAFVNLTAANWTDGEPFTQTVSVPGLAAGANIVVAPDPTSFTAYAESGVYCSSQSEGNVTFTASSKPESDLMANILIVR